MATNKNDNNGFYSEDSPSFDNTSPSYEPNPDNSGFYGSVDTSTYTDLIAQNELALQNIQAMQEQTELSTQNVAETETNLAATAEDVVETAASASAAATSASAASDSLTQAHAVLVDVEEEGNTQVDRVVAEGSTQKGLVESEGSQQIDAATQQAQIATEQAQIAVDAAASLTTGVVPSGLWNASTGAFPPVPDNLNFVNAYRVSAGGILSINSPEGQQPLEVKLNDVIYSTVGTGVWYALKAPELQFVAYEIGDIYVTTRTGNPSTLLGYGTWTAIQDGNSLQAVTSGAGVYSGSNSQAVPLPVHTHTANHDHSATFLGNTLPTHAHTISILDPDGGSSSGQVSKDNRFPKVTRTTSSVSAGTPSGSVSVATKNFSTGSAGSSSATIDTSGANFKVYMWLRTA